MATMEMQEIGRGERIRTSGLYVPNVALYQAKLHPEYSASRPSNRAGAEESESISEPPSKAPTQILARSAVS